MKELTNEYYSYDGIVETFEVEVLLSEYDNDYQGEAFYLLRDSDQYGYLVFGWGSCSGCDWLESCYGDIAGMTELRDSLWDNVQWRSKSEMLVYLQEKDEKLEFYGYGDGYGRFKPKAIDLLSK